MLRLNPESRLMRVVMNQSGVLPKENLVMARLIKSLGMQVKFHELVHLTEVAMKHKKQIRANEITLITIRSFYL